MEDYAHARHLWHRFKDLCPPYFQHMSKNQEFVLNDTDTMTDETTSPSVVADANNSLAEADTIWSMEQNFNNDLNLTDLYQFYILWQFIAKPMLQNKSNVLFVNAKRLLSVREENQDSNVATGTTTYTSSLYEPLLTYVDELIKNYQNRILRRMEERYNVISESTLFLYAFGYTNTLNTNDSSLLTDMRNQIMHRGWKKSSSSDRFWIPTSFPSADTKSDNHKTLKVWNEEKINSMVQTVAALEKKLIL